MRSLVDHYANCVAIGIASSRSPLSKVVDEFSRNLSRRPSKAFSRKISIVPFLRSTGYAMLLSDLIGFALAVGYLDRNFHARTFKAAAALRSGLSKLQMAHLVSSVEPRR
jgi:hypothetical protein